MWAVLESDGLLGAEMPDVRVGVDSGENVVTDSDPPRVRVVVSGAVAVLECSGRRRAGSVSSGYVKSKKCRSSA